MPNHVRNIIKMEGITSLPLFKKGEEAEGLFDFNTVTPMPESLNIESGTRGEKGLRKYKSFLEETRGLSGSAVKEAELRNAQEVGEGVWNLGKQYYENLQKYGFATWYEWAWHNWGTKWNAYDGHTKGTDTVVFLTAWNDPTPVIKQLAAMYPDSVIEHWYADEFAGHNAGYRKYEDGQWIEFIPTDEKQSKKLYRKCWDDVDCDVLPEED